MGVLTTGEAFTTEKCALCGERHPLLTDRAQAIFAKLGFTPDEIARIGAEQAAMSATPFGADPEEEESDEGPPHIKPSDAAEKTRERQARRRARVRAQKGGVTPSE
jgi:hypothetical protein